MTKDELELLRSYQGGPRVWDAVAVLLRVRALEDMGLVEPVGAKGARRLTGAGRKALREAAEGGCPDVE